VTSRFELGESDLRVLAEVESSGASVAALAKRLGQPEETVRACVVRLVQADLLRALAGDQVAPTSRGEMVLDQVRQPGRVPSAPAVPADLAAVAEVVSDWWPSQADRNAARDAELDGVLASDADRDAAVQRLADAFTQGRISSPELDDRTGRALAAHTLGDLDDVLAGLGGLARASANHPVRKVAFGAVAFCCSPFVMVGALFLAFGEDAGDRVFGLVLLVLLLPGLLALWRWAWPGRARH
jgi:hypothetical protein